MINPILNFSLATTSAVPPATLPSFRQPEPLYRIPPVFAPQGQYYIPGPTPVPSTTSVSDQDSDDRAARTDVALAAQPTALKLNKRQIVVAIEVVTVVTVIPVAPAATPVVVTVYVPPPTKTQIDQGGWPIINPGSSSACWSDMACNSVCPNFQQNGWYAHCMDPACSQCRCQIISNQMCVGTVYTNATWSSDAPARTISLGPAVATVTVIVGQGASGGGSFLYNQASRKTKLIGFSGLLLSLAGWLLA